MTQVPFQSARIRRAAIACILIMLPFEKLALADALWSGTPTGAPMLRDAALKIRRIDGDRLIYDYRGAERSIEISKLARISVDDQPVLTAAEDAVAAEKWDVAVDQYQRLMRANPTPATAWIANWAARRLPLAAEKSGRFDAIVSAYIARIQNEPPASVPRPQLPGERSTYLDTAAKEITATLVNPKLNDDHRIALLAFLVDIHRARRDTRAADQAADALDTILSKDPTNPNAARAIARRKIQAAQLAIDKKDFKLAISEIESNRASFTDPPQQADALYLLAEARFQLAATSRQTPPSAADIAALRDSALSFMRVVAHFKDAPGRPRVAAALLRTAQIQELVADPPGAARLYEQLFTQYPDDPNAPAARAAFERLRRPPASAPSAGAP